MATVSVTDSLKDRRRNLETTRLERSTHSGDLNARKEHQNVSSSQLTSFVARKNEDLSGISHRIRSPVTGTCQKSQTCLFLENGRRRINKPAGLLVALVWPGALRNLLTTSHDGEIFFLPRKEMETRNEGQNYEEGDKINVLAVIIILSSCVTLHEGHLVRPSKDTHMLLPRT